MIYSYWNPQDPSSAEQHWREQANESKKNKLAAIQSGQQNHADDLITNMAGLLSQANPAFAETYGKQLKSGATNAYAFASALESYGTYQKQKNEENASFKQNLETTKTEAEVAKEKGLGSYYSSLGQSTLAKIPSSIAKEEADTAEVLAGTQRKNALLPPTIAGMEANITATQQDTTRKKSLLPFDLEKAASEITSAQQKSEFTSQIHRVFQANPDLFQSLAEKMAGSSTATPNQVAESAEQPSQVTTPNRQEAAQPEAANEPWWMSNFVPIKKKKPVFDFGLA